MTSALADTVLSPAADFFPRGVARVSPFTDPFLFLSEREPELPQPRDPAGLPGLGGKRGAWAPGLRSLKGALEEETVAVNHPVGGSLCLGSVRRGQHGESPHLAGRCLALFRL